MFDRVFVESGDPDAPLSQLGRESLLAEPSWWSDPTSSDHKRTWLLYRIDSRLINAAEQRLASARQAVSDESRGSGIVEWQMMHQHAAWIERLARARIESDDVSLILEAAAQQSIANAHERLLAEIAASNELRDRLLAVGTLSSDALTIAQKSAVLVASSLEPSGQEELIDYADEVTLVFKSVEYPGRPADGGLIVQGSPGSNIHKERLSELVLATLHEDGRPFSLDASQRKFEWGADAAIFEIVVEVAKWAGSEAGSALFGGGVTLLAQKIYTWFRDRSDFHAAVDRDDAIARAKDFVLRVWPDDIPIVRRGIVGADGVEDLSDEANVYEMPDVDVLSVVEEFYDERANQWILKIVKNGTTYDVQVRGDGTARVAQGSRTTTASTTEQGS